MTAQLSLPNVAPLELAYLAPGVGVLRRPPGLSHWRLQVLDEDGAPRWKGYLYLRRTALKRMPTLVPVVINPALPWRML